MSDLEAIRKRIRALRAMTAAAGCTEAEAMLAAERAMELMQRHGIDAAELDEPEMDVHIEQRPKRRDPVDDLWSVIAWFCRCRSWSAPGRRVYVGRPGDLLVAEYLHFVLGRAVADARKGFRRSAEYRRRRLARTRNAAERAFVSAMVGRLTERLVVLAWRRHDTGDDERTKALINAPFAAIDAWIAAAGIRLGPARPIKRTGRGFHDAAWAGRRAAADVDINAGVGSAGAGVAGYLSG